LLREQDCAVWLLTEVSERLALRGYALHTTSARMAPRRRWAAILSQAPLVAQPDPHPASALASVGERWYCSTILPWRSCGDDFPWVGARHADKTKAALDQLDGALPRHDLVWGGDWNHALSGTEHAGSLAGRTHLLTTLAGLGLQVPTANLPHRLAGLLSIDHIGVSREVAVVSAERIDANVDGRRLSDHDAYVVRVG
jgi:endonuclease/exonuclease/phosphatase family metal-dependent hydrolase